MTPPQTTRGEGRSTKPQRNLAILRGEALCPNHEDHTQCPEGYLQWHAWAEKMSKTHRSRLCHGCGLYTIWEPKGRTPTPDAKERESDGTLPSA